MVSFRVREVAEVQGLNMQKLSTKAGISYSSIVDLWYDRTRRIDKDTLSRLCHALGVTPGDLLMFEAEEDAEGNLSPGLTRLVSDTREPGIHNG